MNAYQFGQQVASDQGVLSALSKANRFLTPSLTRIPQYLNSGLLTAGIYSLGAASSVVNPVVYGLGAVAAAKTIYDGIKEAF